MKFSYHTAARCGCRGPDGRPLGQRCPKLWRKDGSWNPRHGTMTWRSRVLSSTGTRDLRRTGFTSSGEAERDAGRAGELLALATSESARALVGDLLFSCAGMALPDVETVKVRLGLGRDPGDAGETVGEWFDHFLQVFESQVRRGKRRPNTLEGYEGHVRLYIRPKLGSIPLETIVYNVPAVQKMLDGIPGNTYRQNVFRTLRAGLNRAVKMRRIPWNPCASIDLLERDPSPGQTWRPEQVRLFISHPDAIAHPLYLAFRIGLFVTTRRQEMAALCWTDADLDNGVIWVRQTFNSTREQRWQRPKTKAGYRKIYIGFELAELLRAYRKAQAAARLAATSWWQPGDDEVPDWVHTDLIFCHLDSGHGYRAGMPWHPDTFTHQFQKLCDQVGLPRIRLHDTRRTAISAMANAGIDRDVRKKIAGHAGDEVHDLYTDFWDEALQAAARKTEAFLLGQEPDQPADETGTAAPTLRPQ